MGKNCGDWLSFHQGKTNLFLCRAGYLTLFGGEQNNNSTDPSSVYEEYKKFDGLLTKMARGTLKPGIDAENNSHKEMLHNFISALQVKSQEKAYQRALTSFMDVP